MSDSLEDILGGKSEVTANEEPIENTSEAEVGSEEQDESDDSSTESNSAEPAAETTAPSAETDDIKGLKAALKAERMKRQSLERSMSAPQPAYQPDQIDGYENLARDMHDDYDEVMQHFYDHIDQEDDGTTHNELHQAKNPVAYAYKKGSEIKKMRAEKAESEQKAKEEALRAQIRAEVEAEYAKQGRPKIPPRLPDGGSPAQVDKAGHQSLSSILGR